MIRIQLSTEKKWRNAQEHRPIGTAEACGLKVVGDGPIIDRICQALIEDGHSPDDLCEVYAGETLSFRAKTIGEWASGKALSGKQPEHLRNRSRAAT